MHMYIFISPIVMPSHFYAIFMALYFALYLFSLALFGFYSFLLVRNQISVISYANIAPTQFVVSPVCAFTATNGCVCVCVENIVAIS